SLDFNERAQDPATFTMPGFQPFVIHSNLSSAAVQTQATTRVYGSYAITVSNTAPLGYDDRLRATPVNSGALTESLLLRDFIFSRDDTGIGGLDVSLSGLAANRTHRLTIWSFDSGSPGVRVSDWLANGVPARNNYSFDGNSLPTTDGQYRFSIDASSDNAGTLLLSGRRDSTSAGFGVFLNALQIAEVVPSAPPAGLATLMLSNNATAYLRLPFNVADPTAIAALTLRIRYNDGFIAYLNGQQIAARNAPGSSAWNSVATAVHSAAVAEDIAIIATPGLLLAGANVLAIQGLNVSATDLDFTLAPELYSEQFTPSADRYFQPPTPGTNNATGYTGLVADTKFSVNRGFYETPFALSISCATAGAAIYYTTNGSPPSLTNGYLFGIPIPISRHSFIRSAAFKAGFVPSDIDTHTYIFLRNVLRQSNNIPNYPTTWESSYPADYEIDPNIVNHPFYGPTLSNNLRSIPVLSIVTEHDGLWGPVRGIYNHASSTHDLELGQDWERAASAELILPEGANGSTAFAVNCAVRMQGNASRDNARTPKHSFRLLFKSDYGPSKLRYDWFPGPVEQFDNIVLRAVGFVDAWPSRYSP
ncbi:MAG TPA: chitobiase/beta-hexosaminidase C-terminal domain-containing protein, partial [Verrucomicrobiae bacterium]|nr:chitobiase/beta-hexosaminidase C-terminal domain-containing protein [Verrucomicrobiae bacterium]